MHNRVHELGHSFLTLRRHVHGIRSQQIVDQSGHKVLDNRFNEMLKNKILRENLLCIILYSCNIHKKAIKKKNLYTFKSSSSNCMSLCTIAM